MVNHKEILRLKSLGLTHREITDATGCGRNTVTRTLARAREQKLSWPQAQSMSQQEVSQRLFPTEQKDPVYKMPDYEWVHREMQKSGVTLSLLWVEYCEQCRQSGELPYLQWNGERFIRWAEQIGQHTAAVVRLFLSAHKVEQQGYKSCMALLKLADRYSAQRLESACRKALSYTVSPSLKSVQSILKSGQDKLLAEDAPAKPEEPKAHKFTRGAGYYKRGE